MQTYKKRPIYWLFSSGKFRAFECLVYIHRYNESTLSRMRMEYVRPLQSRMAARIEQLDKEGHRRKVVLCRPHKVSEGKGPHGEAA